MNTIKKINIAITYETEAADRLEASLERLEAAKAAEAEAKSFYVPMISAANNAMLTCVYEQCKPLIEAMDQINKDEYLISEIEVRVNDYNIEVWPSKRGKTGIDQIQVADNSGVCGGRFPQSIASASRFRDDVLANWEANQVYQKLEDALVRKIDAMSSRHEKHIAELSATLRSLIREDGEDIRGILENMP